MCQCILDVLKSPNDTAPGLHQKALLLFFGTLLGAGGALWGAVYAFLGAYLACIFPFLLTLLSLSGLALLLCTKQPSAPRAFLAWGLGLCAIGVHFSLGAQAASVVSWALLAPQIQCFTGGNAWSATVLLVLAVAASIAGDLLPPYDSPWRPSLPDHWQFGLVMANGIVPWVVLFVMSALAFRQVRALQDLQESMETAEELAQKIVDFDLDDLADLQVPAGNAVLDILQQVAANLRLYRPYIPGHLLPDKFGDAEEEEEEEEKTTVRNPEAASPMAHTLRSSRSCRILHSPSSQASPNHALASLPGRPYEVPPSPKVGATLRAPVRSFEVPHLLRCGTLLYVKLHKLEAYVRHGADAAKVERFRKSANLFAEIVMAAVRETRGVLQSMQHNVCLIGWNFISTCRPHAANACHAALMIRDRIHALDPELVAPMNVSMGLWTGQLVSGTFGTHDFKAAGTVGYGVRRAHELQKYAVKHQRTIIANADAREAVALNPNVRLVPVDVLEVEGAPSHTRPCDLVHGGAEIIYEVVQEVPVADDEWMYQLEAMSRDAGDDGMLETLLRQARDGVPETQEFQRQVAALQVCEDAAVSRVAEYLARLAQEGALAKAYRLTLTSTWERRTGAAGAAEAAKAPANQKSTDSMAPFTLTSSLGPHSSFTNASPPRRLTTLALTDTHGRTTFTKSDGPTWTTPAPPTT